MAKKPLEPTAKLQVTYKTRRSASIDAYLGDAIFLWRRDFKERSVFDLWLHVVDHCTRLVEAVRKERPREVIDDLADTAMWFLSFFAQLQHSTNAVDAPFRIATSLSDVIWNKYPGRCPACLDFEFTAILQTVAAATPSQALHMKAGEIIAWIKDNAAHAETTTPCHCLSRIRFAEERHQLFKSIAPKLDDFRLAYADAARKAKRTAMHDLEKLFDGLFGHSYQVYSIHTIAFHLLEEVGEVSQALKDCYTFDAQREPFSDKLLARRKRKLEEEIADVLSWLHALMLKLRNVYYRDAAGYFNSVLAPFKILKVDEETLIQAISLADIIWAKYGSDDGSPRPHLVCAACQHAPCDCPRQLKIAWTGQTHIEDPRSVIR